MSSVQRGQAVGAGQKFRVAEDVLFEMPTASSNVSIDFGNGGNGASQNIEIANVGNLVENLNIQNIQIGHERVPSYQKWAFQGGEESDVRAGLRNFDKQESTQTVVANDD